MRIKALFSLSNQIPLELLLPYPGLVAGHEQDGLSFRVKGECDPDRIVPKPTHEAELKKRTLTNLYNERPAWLANAHAKLDAAVVPAYGWPADLADEEILRRLLALNLVRLRRKREALRT